MLALPCPSRQVLEGRSKAGWNPTPGPRPASPHSCRPCRGPPITPRLQGPAQSCRNASLAAPCRHSPVTPPRTSLDRTLLLSSRRIAKSEASTCQCTGNVAITIRGRLLPISRSASFGSQYPGVGVDTRHCQGPHTPCRHAQRRLGGRKLCQYATCCCAAIYDWAGWKHR